MPPIWYDGGSFKLYFYARETHRLPHVAVMAGRRRLATLAIESGELLAGELTVPQRRAVREILTVHRAEALTAFEAALAGDPIVRLDSPGVEGASE